VQVSRELEKWQSRALGSGFEQGFRSTSMRILSRLCLAMLSAATIAGGASAHHSHSMFDHDREVTLTGKVTKFSFLNPHVSLFIEVEEDNGERVSYWIEMSNISNMIRRGIGQRTFKAGDVITVSFWPLRDGRPGGNYITVVAADGKTYE
jgi:hypothetical protein